MKSAAAKTFDEYAQQVFISYISSQLRSVSRVDLVWDIYKDDSLKGTTRAKRGKGVRRRVGGKAAVPGNWQNGLTATRHNYSVSSPRSSFSHEEADRRMLLHVTPYTHSHC